MYDTLKVMSAINVDDLKEYSINEVAEMISVVYDKYKQGKTYKPITSPDDKNLVNKCTAKIFCELFPMFLTIYNKYGVLTPARRVEEIMDGLFRSIRKYKQGECVKFTSYVYGNIDRGMINAMKSVTQSRGHKVWMYLVKGTAEKINYVMNSIRDNDSLQNTKRLEREIDTSPILNEMEKRYCKSVLHGYRKSLDIVNDMNLTTLPRLDKKSNTYVTVPVDQDEAKKFVLTLKKQIKKKVSKNNYSIL